MLGWKQRVFFPSIPFLLPRILAPQGTHGCCRWVMPLMCMLFTFICAVSARLLELPYWENSAYKLGEEYLLATHDAYHWIAGAEGFEFGVGHPMSELAKLLSQMTGLSIPNIGFWLPPFMGGLLGVAVFWWGWGLGAPYSGFCAGVLASLSPAFLARTLLGFFDTDLVVLLFAVVLGLIPALWLSPWLISLYECMCQMWSKRSQQAPALSSRMSTKKDQRKKDTVQLRTIHSANALVSFRRIRHHRALESQELNTVEVLSLSAGDMASAMLSWQWLILLLLSGWFAHWMQDWHSLFPYLVRFSALIIPVLIILFGPQGGRYALLNGAICYALPVLLGIPGVGIAALYGGLLLFGLVPSLQQQGEVADAEKASEQPSYFTVLINKLLWNYKTLLVIWCVILILACDKDVYDALVSSFKAYLHRDGDITSQATSVTDPLIFPSVTPSIIEVQKVTFWEVLNYSYPNGLIARCSLYAFAFMLLFVPSFIWYLPLLVLSLLSVKLGGRMAMFGSPTLMLPLCFIGGLICEQAYCLLLRGIEVYREWIAKQQVSFFEGVQLFFAKPFLVTRLLAAILIIICLPLVVFGGAFAAKVMGKIWRIIVPAEGNGAAEQPLQYCYFESSREMSWWTGLMKFSCACCAVFMLSYQLIIFIPDYTQGPVISQHHAEALTYIKHTTHPDAIVWNWWDWGYATHHFARRAAIADGARHGGPSLYLPAAVYTTADPRFARQLIKYTASMGNNPGNVFKGLSATGAQELMRRLGNKNEPLIDAPGKQYIVVSFELLRLGIWVTRHGSWNFITKTGPGALMNNLSQALEFNLQSGEVIPRGGNPILAASIDVFRKEDLTHRLYPQNKAYHFIFNLENFNTTELAHNQSREWMKQFWQWQRGGFAFTAPTNDKMVVDDVFYNTLMAQLLLGKKDDPKFSPYFKLVFDNVYTRVYEVQ